MPLSRAIWPPLSVVPSLSSRLIALQTITTFYCTGAFTFHCTVSPFGSFIACTMAALALSHIDGPAALIGL
mgnify:CR=1 FL=1